MITDNIKVIGKTIHFSFVPLLFNGTSPKYQIDKNNENEWAFRSATATGGKRYFYGKIIEKNEPYCSVINYKTKQKAVNAIIKESGVYNIGDDVAVFEHIDVGGFPNVLATKSPINISDDDFINIGWCDDKRARFLRIDVYTGESKYLESSPVPLFCRIQ